MRRAGFSRDVARVCIEQHVYHAIRSAAETSDTEICGGLYGSTDEHVVTILAWRPCRNEEPSGDSFSLTISDLFDGAPAGPSEEHWDLLGICHSHVREPARLSATDRDFLRLSRYLWLIAGRAAGTGLFEMRCYVPIGSSVKEMPWTVVEGKTG